MDIRIVIYVLIGIVFVILVVGVVLFGGSLGSSLTQLAVDAGMQFQRVFDIMRHFAARIVGTVARIARAMRDAFVGILRQIALAFDQLPNLVNQIGRTVQTQMNIAIQGATAQISSLSEIIITNIDTTTTGLFANFKEFTGRFIRQVAAGIAGLFPRLIRLAIYAAESAVNVIVDAALFIFNALSELGATFAAGFLQAINAAISVSTDVYNVVFGGLRDSLAAMCSVFGCSV